LATGILRVKLLSMREPDSAGREAELAHEVCARCDAWDRGAVAAWLRRTGSPRPPHTDLAEPYRLQVAGDWEAAARLWTSLGCLYAAGLALYDAAAEAPLRAALKHFTDLGALAAVQLTRRKMRQLGIRSIPAGPRAATRAIRSAGCPYPWHRGIARRAPRARRPGDKIGNELGKLGNHSRSGTVVSRPTVALSAKRREIRRRKDEWEQRNDSHNTARAAAGRRHGIG
jgi:hypothetical protein